MTIVGKHEIINITLVVRFEIETPASALINGTKGVGIYMRVRCFQNTAIIGSPRVCYNLCDSIPWWKFSSLALQFNEIFPIINFPGRTSVIYYDVSCTSGRGIQIPLPSRSGTDGNILLVRFFQNVAPWTRALYILDDRQFSCLGLRRWCID